LAQVIESVILNYTDDFKFY